MVSVPLPKTTRTVQVASAIKAKTDRDIVQKSEDRYIKRFLGFDMRTNVKIDADGNITLPMGLNVLRITLGWDVLHVLVYNDCEACGLSVGDEGVKRAVKDSWKCPGSTSQ